MPNEKIHVREEDAVRVDWRKLQDFIARCYVAAGVEPADAQDAAEISVMADLYGIDTHGVSNAPRNVYVPGMQRGDINPRPQVEIVQETGNTAVVDGDRGLGFIVARYSMSLAISKAKERSIGSVAVRNSRHFGAAGMYSMMALKHDPIGLAMTNAPPCVVPTYGREPRFGTNPIAVAVPAGREQFWSLDMATSTVAMNRVILAARLGRTIPSSWALDREGNPTTDPRAAREARLMLPLGGTPEGSNYKGYGLAVWVDIMCGVLSGHGFGRRLTSGQAGHFFAAIDPAAFVPIDQFKSMMDELLEDLRNTPAAPGYDHVLYAGMQERATEAERRMKGIPLHTSTIGEFKEMARELGVEYDLSE